MRFSPDFLEDLKARLPVSEVVGRRVSLKKAGREWRGLSPFNKEKTPSFFVNDQKQAWFDFSSQKNGSIFDFVMMTEGVTFPEAVERLASMAGVPLPRSTPEAEAREERRKTLHDIVELAAKFFETTLAARAGAKARGYLTDRGLEPKTQLRFRIGYAPPDRFALKEHLGAQGVSAEDMIEAGLLVSGEDIPVPYDRFRDRVMFPITDLRGRVIAFGGRALEKDAQAKYLNSPETPLFHKGGTLYNIAAARRAAHDGAPIVVVEGYIDVIAMVTAGYEAAVAPLGTALTEDQLALLWKMADEPLLCFDGDGAGRRAAYRAVDLALPHIKPGKTVTFALLPEGQDPDDLVRSGGREAIGEVIGAARPLAEMLWQRETEAGGFDTPERRAGLEQRIAEVTNVIGDPAVRKYYRQDLEERIRALFAPAMREGNTQRWERGRFGDQARWQGKGRQGRRPAPREVLGTSSARLAGSQIVRGARNVLPSREALILLAVINHPWLLETHAEELAELEFRHADGDRLRRAILDTASGHALAPAALRAGITARELGAVLARVEASITHSSDWPAREGAAEEDVSLWWTHVVSLHRKSRTLHKELKDAEAALGAEPSEENLAWLRDIQTRLGALDGSEALIDGFGAPSGRPVRTF
ncbi:MAG: DNA primase [Alphaproteobacteria bacterium]|nr:MAG: DNA primase [Alphaproteobacteria bacterium]